MITKVVLLQATLVLVKPICVKDYKMNYQPLLYTGMSRSTKKSYINLIDFKPEVSIGYIYKITDSKGNIYI